MKQTYVKYLIVAVLAGGFLFTSCRSARETTANYEVGKRYFIFCLLCNNLVINKILRVCDIV